MGRSFPSHARARRPGGAKRCPAERTHAALAPHTTNSLANFKHFANVALQMEKQSGERIAQLESEVSELRDAKAKTDARLQDYMAAADPT